NAGDGLVIQLSATANTIGGTDLSLGNLISANKGNGVLLSTGATANFLGANFIGTNVSGTVALGNVLDGVAVLSGANNNSISGTFINLPPFVFKNVISGNLGNGIRVHDANNTVIQANFFG